MPTCEPAAKGPCDGSAPDRGANDHPCGPSRVGTSGERRISSDGRASVPSGVHQATAELTIPDVWKARLREQLAKDVPIEEDDWRIFGPRGDFGRLSVPLG